MLLKVFKDDIIEGLQKSANIIPAKTGAAYLRTIWMSASAEGVKIMSTDSNLEFCGAYQGEVVEEGLAGIQGRSFYDLVRKLPPGEITFKLDEENKTLLIQQGARKYKLPTNESTWFQNFSDFPEENSVFWSGDFLQELIDKIAFCISDEDSMEAIACISLRPMGASDTPADSRFIEACGLNGHQFAMMRFLNDDLYEMLPEEGILIQKKYLIELKKWLSTDEIELSISNKRLFFRTGSKTETFSMPLSYYTYPDYNNFLAKLNGDDVSTLDVSRPELTHTLERLLIFNTDNNRCTYFDLNPAELVLSSQGQEIGSATESLPAAYSGDLKRIAFPTRNLIEIMNHYSSEALKFVFTGAEGPCGLRGEDDPEYSVIIMPMKIVEETYYSEEDA